MKNIYVCMTCGKRVEKEQTHCACGHNKIGYYPKSLLEKSND